MNKGIPFMHDRNWALKIFNNYIKKRIFSDNDFKKNMHVIDIEKVYVPLFVCTVSANAHAFIVLHTYSTVDDPGTTAYFERKLDSVLEITTSASKEELNGIYFSNILPYDFTKLTDHLNVDCKLLEAYENLSQSEAFVKDEAEKKLYDIFKKSCHFFGIQNYDITSKNNIVLLEYCTVLVPMWIVKIKSNDKDYFFYINDQNGKISGDIPTIEKRFGFKHILSLAIISTLFILLALFISLELNQANILYITIITVLALFLLMLIYSGMISSYTKNFKGIPVKVISKKFLKKKRYFLDVTYQKALEKFNKQ